MALAFAPEREKRRDPKGLRLLFFGWHTAQSTRQAAGQRTVLHALAGSLLTGVILDTAKEQTILEINHPIYFFVFCEKYFSHFSESLDFVDNSCTFLLDF